jgi:L-fuconolactonase
MTIEKTGKSERIDSHVHFWQPSRFEYHWLTPGSTLDRDWTPEMLSPQLQTAGVDGCIVMEATNREHEIEWLAALCDQHPFVRGAVGWVELRQPDAPHKLAAWTKTYPYAFKGVRLNMLTAQDCANPDALTPALHTLARFGLTCDVLLNEAFSEQVLHLVQAHPQVTFVLGHFAGATLARNRITQWADTVRSG